jgi:predicted metalloprotease
MRWTPGGVSGDIEDRRGETGGGGMGFGGFGASGLGIGGTLLLLVLSVVFRQNFFALFSGGAPVDQGTRVERPVSETPGEQREVQFVSFVLDDAQGTWDKLLPEQAGTQYRHARLVLFRDATQSSCGTAQTATGPFYCPGDEKVYIDLGFFDELKERFGAPGEFAQAYVIAHELGHHVQKILGYERQVRRLQQANPESANRLSVALELQADCLAGVLGHSTSQRNLNNEQDVTEGLRAAAAVGDDRIQRMTRGYVSPESFTHGSSEQRTTWFRRGLQSGNLSSCETLR